MYVALRAQGLVQVHCILSLKTLTGMKPKLSYSVQHHESEQLGIEASLTYIVYC